MLASRASVAALLPCYSEEKHLRTLLARVQAEVDTILVVDDGSPDHTAQEAQKAGVECIKHLTNQGKGAAIKTGLRALQERSGIDYVLILDGDGQHLPEEIPRFFEAANQQSAPLILGTRMSDTRTMPWLRRLTNQTMSSQISRVCGQKISDTQCGFRLIRRDFFQGLIAIETNQFDYETEMLVVTSRLGGKIGAVPISTVYGDEISKIHPIRDTMRFLQMMARFRREAKIQP